MPTNPFENSKTYGQKRGFIVPFVAVFLAIMTVGAAVLLPIMAISSHFRHQGDPLNQVFGGGQGLRGVLSPYDEIFQRAGSQFQVQPAFLAAIFVSEHGPAKIYRPGYEPVTSPGAQWPEAGGDPEAIILWDDSGAGALGPFQFMPGTWPDHAQDGNGDGRKDHENIVDAAFAAAHYLAGVGAGGYTTDLDRLRDAATKYNAGPGRSWSEGDRLPQETLDYVPKVIDFFETFYAPEEVGGIFTGTIFPPLGSKQTAPNTYNNHSIFSANRTMQPVYWNNQPIINFCNKGEGHYCGFTSGANDFSVPAGTPIYAITDGTVFEVENDEYGLSYLFFRSSDGNFKAVYAHINPNVRLGSTVTRESQLGTVGNLRTIDHLHFELIYRNQLINQKDHPQYWQQGGQNE